MWLVCNHCKKVTEFNKKDWYVTATSRHRNVIETESFRPHQKNHLGFILFFCLLVMIYECLSIVYWSFVFVKRMLCGLKHHVSPILYILSFEQHLRFDRSLFRKLHGNVLRYNLISFLLKLIQPKNLPRKYFATIPYKFHHAIH